MERPEGCRFSKEPFIRRPGRALCGQQHGIIGELDLLVSAGWPVPEGMVVTREAHRAFLLSSGLMDEILAHAAREPREWVLTPRVRDTSILIEGELNRALCDALIDLGAPSVVVISDGVRKGDLKSIPEVKEVIREAWLSERGWQRQVRAAACGEVIPTSPVLIQKEVRPQYTGWSITGRVEHGTTPGGAMAFCAVEPAEDPPPGAVTALPEGDALRSSRSLLKGPTRGSQRGKV